MLPTTVRAAAEMPAWETASVGVIGGVSRFNAALRHARDAGSYPYALDVFVPSVRLGPRGHHGSAEPESSTEDKVTEVVADRAVLAGVIMSRDGAQRFVFYTASPDWITRLQGQLRAATRIGNLHVCCDPDERWYAYRNLRGTELIRARALARSVPCATSLLLWAIVTPAHGRGWCAGELALLALWLAALALPRAYGRWFTGHPAMLLASRAAAGAMVVFPLLALTRVPAWPGLVISLLAGAGLLAAVARAARSRTGGAVTRRARGGIFSTRYGRIRSLK
jgi:hypothetical protein